MKKKKNNKNKNKKNTALKLVFRNEYSLPGDKDRTTLFLSKYYVIPMTMIFDVSQTRFASPVATVRHFSPCSRQALSII